MAGSATLSTAVQDYLKQIHCLQVEGGRASTSAIAERMNVTAASVSGMLKTLAALGLIEHRRYHGVRLTDAGERAAVEVIRHHRLLEQYLSVSVGLPIDAVHDEADRLEHALSEELEERIDEILGYPTRDPHGHPIPGADLQLESESTRRLSELRPHERATVRHVPDDDPELLRHLADLGLVPGAEIRLLRTAPLGGPLTLRAGRGEHTISRELAQRVHVWPEG